MKNFVLLVCKFFLSKLSYFISSCDIIYVLTINLNMYIMEDSLTTSFYLNIFERKG